MDYLSTFRRIADDPGNAEAEYLLLPGWRDLDWQKLFAVTTSRSFKASEFVIQRGVKDRALYLVASGLLEVGVTYVDGVSISPLAKIGAGGVIGEQSFFDAQPRSANVFAVTDGELLCLMPEKFHELSEAEPALARDLVFALARILSLRLRHTTFRVRH
jgi:CRP-like cAMP-binding protein